MKPDWPLRRKEGETGFADKTEPEGPVEFREALHLVRITRPESRASFGWPACADSPFLTTGTFNLLSKSVRAKAYTLAARLSRHFGTLQNRLGEPVLRPRFLRLWPAPLRGQTLAANLSNLPRIAACCQPTPGAGTKLGNQVPHRRGEQRAQLKPARHMNPASEERRANARYVPPPRRRRKHAQTRPEAGKNS